MPRTAKKGFTYYGFDTDHFYDPKVKRLKNKFGMEGWAVFHFIVNEIHRVEGYYMIMDSDGLFDVSDYSRMDEQRIAGWGFSTKGFGGAVRFLPARRYRTGIWASASLSTASLPSRMTTCF